MRHPRREVEEDNNKRLKDGLGGGALSAAAEAERGGGLGEESLIMWYVV
jgi:hypothetical protein